MNTTHFRPFLAAMERGDATALRDHLSDQIVLRSPIRPDPVEGKAAVLKLLETLVEIADRFEVTDILEGTDHAAVFVRIQAGEVITEGVHDVHVDGKGLLRGMTQQWRPLPSVVAMQQRMTTVLGLQPLKLVPAQ